MALSVSRLKPKVGFSHLFHISFNIVLPILVFILVRTNFAQIALVLILLSKWRMLAVKPRYWLVNLRSNAVDIMVAVSLLIFMTHTASYSWQLGWSLFYVIWLLFIKPGSNILLVSAQAFIGQILGLTGVFLWLSGAPLYQLIIVVWVVCYLTARHYFAVFEESFSSLYSHTWGYFAAALTWVLGHWLLFYSFMSQPTLLLSVIGMGIGSLYYLFQIDKLNNLIRKQIVLILVAVIIIVLVFSNWSSKIV